MVAALFWISLLSLQGAPGRAATAPADTLPADSARAPSRVVRRFPPVEVRAPFFDPRSSETVHVVSGTALRSFPIDRLADLLALQPGVVAEAEELHVRGGRAGETAVALDGLSIQEPLRHRALEVPLLALRGAELVSGAPGAQYASGIAGALDLSTADPGERPAVEWRWQSDGRTGTHFDRVAMRLDAPLELLGLGLMTAGEATLDDTALPMLRSISRRSIAGLSFGWRAENRMLGLIKLAPVREPQRFTAQLLVGRQVHRPYDPAWTLDGWVYLPANPKATPDFSPDSLPGYRRYRAADHLAVTDQDDLAALISVSTLRARGHGTLSLGWLRSRAVTSLSGGHETGDFVHRASFANEINGDRFLVLWGDYPLYRESGSDVLTLRGDVDLATKSGGGALKAGLGLTYESVSMLEWDWQFIGWGWTPGEITPGATDSLRSFHAYAPGSFAYVQGRWESGGLVMNTGVRAEYFTAGPQADQQTLPGSASGVWTFSPRLGFAYPISTRDVFSLAYSRIHQAPGRDFLYDRRQAITNRQPLGNPALEPATAISYEAATKHMLIFRDVYGQVGPRDLTTPGGVVDLRYANEDQGQALGFEWSLLHDVSEHRRIEASYTWMQAWGNESRSEGDPYGPVRGLRTPPLGDQPLSWDRRHSFFVSGTWAWRERWSLAWSTAVGSPLPWTPKPRRAANTDLSLVNSRRLGWTENTNLNLQWSPPRALGLTFGLEVRNLFDNRAERTATVDGYPNPLINTLYDDYGAYRTETGLSGGAYWQDGADGAPGYWVPVHDPRLFYPPRALRASVGASW